MLTEDERREIEELLKHRENPREASVDALKIVQRHRGWVSDELTDIAAMLGISPTALDSVASFYSLVFRRPVGKHVILVCDSVSCWIMGYKKVIDHLATRLGVGLGETTADGQFTLLPVACLGACEQAPAMMVDDTLYGNLTPEGMDEILRQYA
jgi:NADH-quinone oxidoreductase subunit E